MACHPAGLSSWIEEVSTRLPQLSKPQATVLALYSYGMVVVQSCGISSIAYALALLLGKKEGTLRQCLREWTYDAVDKRGKKRQAVEVTACFAPLLRWVLSWWEGDEKQLALAMDASTLGQRFTVLSISVVYRGGAIPVAWVVLRATEKEAWKPHWLRLLASLQEAVPNDWTVIVLTDRGLYARWLFKAIQQLHWHPFMRINHQGNFRPRGQVRFRPLTSVVPQVGTAWSGEVECFSSPQARLQATLLACWEAGCTDPWLILTDLPPQTADVAWYGMRTWIEQGFKDGKRGGFRWEHTKMTDPARATRLWLVIALATLWVVSVGGAIDAGLAPSSLEALPDTHIARRTATGHPAPRRLSCFRRGLIALLVALIADHPVPSGRFIPEPWPHFSLDPPLLHSTQGLASYALFQKTYP